MNSLSKIILSILKFFARRNISNSDAPKIRDHRNKPPEAILENPTAKIATVDASPILDFVQKNGSAKAVKRLYIRKEQPSTQALIVEDVSVGTILQFVGWVTNGENFAGVTKWFKNEAGNYFWAGNVEVSPEVIKTTQNKEQITAQQLCAIIPPLPLDKANAVLTHFHQTLEEFGIDTPIRQAAFIAQTACESQYHKFVESLWYSPQRLTVVWPKVFTVEKAALYAASPEKLANFIYAGVNGNGNEASGDGWKYRGRGVIQTTGRWNYKVCGEGIGFDLINSPEILEDPLQAFRSGGWYWKSHDLNPFADREDVLAITKIINGGTNGLPERKQYYARAKAVLGIP